MKKTVKAKIKWLDFKSGGRKKPPSGPRYSTVVRFKGDSDWPETTWSVVLEFDEADSLLETQATMYFLAYDHPKTPNRFLEFGNQFELFEGKQVVATGKITA